MPWRDGQHTIDRPALSAIAPLDTQDDMVPMISRRRPIRLALAAAFLLPGLLAGCGGGDRGSAKPLADATLTDPNGLQPPMVPGQGRANDAQEAGAGLQVNKYLWRGALETLGFAPFVSTDPFGGVIVTDWYAPPGTTGERFKVTAYVLGRALRADGVRVTVFRQTREGGAWADASVSSATSTEIEGKVMARARELRAQGAQ